MAEASGDSIPLSEVDRRVLECAICQERYKSPKILNCHHSFCKPCLDEWVKANNGKLCCPSCRIECPLPSEGVSRLRDNTFLNDLIDVIQESGSTTQSAKCESCKQTDASHWCKDCAQFYCSGCDVVHDTVRLLKGHARMTVKEYNEQKETEHFKLLQPRFCDVHPSSQLEFFCDSCQHPVCLKCSITKHKSPEHDVISTEDAIQKYRPSMEMYANELGKDEAKLNEAKQVVTHVAQSFSRSRTNTETQVTTATDDIHEDIKTEKAELLQNIDEKYRIHEKQIQAQLENLDQRIGSIKSMHSYLTHVLRYGNAVDILSAKKLTTEKPLDRDSIDMEIKETKDGEKQLLFEKSSNPPYIGDVTCQEKVKVISKQGVSDVTDKEMSNIKRLAEKYNVKLKVDEGRALRLQGSPRAVMAIEWEVELAIEWKERKERRKQRPQHFFSRFFGRVESPEFWNEIAGNDEVRSVVLNNTSAEYANVATSFNHSFQPHRIIKKIERIQNQRLYKSVMGTENRERLLYYGTAAGNVDKINRCGFNRTHNAAFYKYGSYFSVYSYLASATHSPPDQNTGLRYVYQAKVSTVCVPGKVAKFISPPSVAPGTSKALDASIAEEEENPSPFVVVMDADAYPEYLITFI